MRMWLVVAAGGLSMLVLVTASSRIVVVDGSIVTRMPLLGVAGDRACDDAVVLWFWDALVRRLLVMPDVAGEDGVVGRWKESV